MPTCTVPDAELGLLLDGFQARHSEQAKQFLSVVGPMLTRLAHRYARDLPSDLQEEVVQETFALLLRPNLARFDATRGTVQQYLIGFVLNAVTQIRTKYGRPRPTPKKDGVSPRKGPQIVALEEAPQKFQVTNNALSLHQKIAAQQVFEKASPVLQLVFERMCVQDEPQTRVAAHLGIDRFVLRRQVVAFAQEFAQQFTAIQSCA
ncbi:MAG: hypothetical protein HYZ72_10710 [Deltaproteobacteria bacterium]|nr:hypothetical protein [Deltaproteobacteria bacterium]